MASADACTLADAATLQIELNIEPDWTVSRLDLLHLAPSAGSARACRVV